MSDGAVLLIVLATLWLGWPLWSIANDINALRRLAERGR
jgi:hypothetical protein